MVGELVDELPTSDRDDVLDMTIVGNPIMHHVMLGIDPTPLGQAPFLLATDSAVTLRAATSISTPVRRGVPAPLHRRSRRCRHRRGDPRRGPAPRRRPQLLVDVGTNAEIVFGNADHVLAASSPTGPAFEGAQISGGHARDGGCDRAGAHRPRDAGTAGQGDRIRRVVRRRAVRHADVQPRHLRHLRVGDHRGDGRAVSRRADRRRRHDPLRRTVEDGPRVRRRTDVLVPPVRRLGRPSPTTSTSRRTTSGRSNSRRRRCARASICCASTPARPIRTTSVRSGSPGRSAPTSTRSTPRCSASSPTFRSPRCRLGRQRCRRRRRPSAALTSAARRDRSNGPRVEKIETATEPRFQELFVNAMGFPHTSDATPNLATETELPAAQERAASAGSRQRTGRRRPRT